MESFRLRLGGLAITIQLPPGVLAAMLPYYLKDIAAPIIPEGALELALQTLEEAPSSAADCTGRYGLGRAACIGPEPAGGAGCERWTFYVHLPYGPERPDRLPTTCVLPSLYLALAERGIHAVHASAVLGEDSRAIVAVGPSGRGKSTVAAALVEGGATPFADDRILLLAQDEEWWAIASPECPNPFARRVGYPAESGPVPQRVPHGTVTQARVGGLLFPSVEPGASSAFEPTTSAQAAVLLHASGGPPPVATTRGESNTGYPPLPPALRLTLGRDAATIFARLRASFPPAASPLTIGAPGRENGSASAHAPSSCMRRP